MELLSTFFALLFAATSSAPLLGSQGISQLDQWRATTTPFAAITTQTHGKGIYAPYSHATTSSLTANVLCLTGDGCQTTWPTGGAGAFAWTPQSWGNSTSTTLGFLNGFLANASSTITASTTITGPLTAPGGIFGNLTGTASLATALAANGTNCSAGSFPLGVDASGNAETCTDAWTEAENTVAAYISLSNLSASSPLIYNSGTGALSFVGLATTSQPSWSNLLTSDGGAGVYGTATSTLTATSPLTGSFVQVGSGGSLGCQTASGSQAGCLSSTDWTTFNNKQGALTAGIDYEVPLTFGNGLTRTANDVDCDTASGSTFGCLSSSDWTTFNAKLGSYDAWSHAVSGTSATSTEIRLTGGLLSTASSTFTGNATTTGNHGFGSIRVPSLTSALLQTDGNGLFAEYAGDSCAGGQFVTALSALGLVTCDTPPSATFAWTPTTFGSTAANSTSTLIGFTAGLYSTAATSTIVNLTTVESTSTNATTTNLYVSGRTRIGSGSGVLITTSGVVSQGADGTDYTLINANTCTNQVFTAATAAGVFTCSTVSNAMLANSTISGISLGSNLANLSATNSTLTFSGTYNGSTARTIGLNLSNANTWGATQTFSSGITLSAASAGSMILSLDASKNLAATSTPTAAAYLATSSAVKSIFPNASTTNLTASASLYVGSHQYPPYDEVSWSYSTSTQGTGTTTKSAIKVMSGSGVFTTVNCYFNQHMRVLAYDVSGNRMNDFIASSTQGTVTLSTNNSFTNNEPIYFDVGTTTDLGTLVEGGCTFRFTRN